MPAFLIHTSVKATIVLLVAWLVTRAMARCSAAARHLVWTLAIVAALLLPLVQVAAPRWNVPLLAAPAVTPARLAVSATASPSTLAPAQPVDTSLEQDATRARVTPAAAAVVEPLPAVPAATGVSWVAAAMAVWIAGVTMALARLAAGLAWVSRITREAADVEDPEWMALLNELAAACAITAPVSLKISSDATIPVMCGIWAPTILLPPEAAGWPDPRRRVVLLHELAHVARRDCLVRTIAQLVRALYWFNPFAHLAAARLRVEQERAADDLVLAAGTDAPVYADHLFEIARTFRSEPYPQWATVAMARPSNLEGRVRDILDDGRNRRPPSRGVRATVGASAAALILPIGALQVTAAPRPADLEGMPVMAAGDRGPATVAPASIDTAPPAVMAIDSPGRDPQSGATVRAGGQFVDRRPDIDVDVDPDVADAPPGPNPNPPPDPLSWTPEFLPRLNLRGVEPSQAPAPPQSPDPAVSDETRRRVADALLTALNDENEDVRVQALAALAAMRDPRAIPGLLKASRDASVDVREQALTALAQFDTPEAAQAILAALKDQSPDVRERAARLMAVLAARGRMNDAKSVAVLSDLLKDAAPDVRVQAIVALGRMRRQDAVPSLLPMLKDMDAGVRQQAAVALGNIADPGAITALTAALKDPEPEVREQATRALGRIARGQQRVNPGSLLPVPPVPPVPLLLPRSPQVHLDTEAINRAVQQARDRLQRELPTLELEIQRQRQDVEDQQEDMQRQAEEIQREAERLLR